MVSENDFDVFIPKGKTFYLYLRFGRYPKNPDVNILNKIEWILLWKVVI